MTHGFFHTAANGWSSEFSAPCSQTTGRAPAWTDASMDNVGVIPTPPEINTMGAASSASHFFSACAMYGSN